jgi:hypothetical protein
LKVHQMIATEAVLKKLEPTHNRGVRLVLGIFAVSRTENALCEAKITTLTEMRKLNNTKATIREVTNKEHPIRLFCTNPSKIDEYPLRSKIPKPIFIRAALHLGTLQIEMRKIETIPQYNRPIWTTIDHRSQQSTFPRGNKPDIERKIRRYTQTGPRKKKKSDTP